VKGQYNNFLILQTKSFNLRSKALLVHDALAFDNFTAAVSTNASCDMPAGIPNFDAQNYMGVWYEQTHTKGQWFEGDNITCAQA